MASVGPVRQLKLSIPSRFGAIYYVNFPAIQRSDGLRERPCGIMAGFAIRRNDENSAAEEDRLLKLFRNRSELKKEFEKLRQSGEKLKKQLEAQEGETLRSQQQLRQLEGMLAHPVLAANASVFYQLRGIWDHCHRKLVKLRENLLAHRRDQEIKLELNRFNATRNAALSAIKRQVDDARTQYEKFKDEHDELQSERLRAKGFWNYFKRREINRKLETAGVSSNAAKVVLKECMEQVRLKEETPPPEFGELSIEGRRSINLMLISIAQELFLYFSKHKVSKLARDASVREVKDVNYGDINACREMNIHIDKCLRKLPSGQELVASARLRAAQLEKSASYRQDSDTVPVAGSFAQIPVDFADQENTRSRQTVNVNVLADDYWDIYSILIN